MATQPSAFFSDYATDPALAAILANVPDGSGAKYLFDRVFDSMNSTSEVIKPESANNEDDIFLVDPGDVAKGGGGYDAVVQTSGDLTLHKSVEAGVLGGTDDANLFGNDKDNNLIGNSGINELSGGDGKDVLAGNDGGDKLLGGDDNDKLFGDAGDDILKGGAGNDKLSGLGDDDQLFGGGGKDTLLGGLGNDTIFGGQGADKLIGDDGADIFGFKKGEEGTDVIKDFEVGTDKIDLSDFGTSFDELKIKNDDGGAVVTVGKGGSAVKFKLLGFNKNDIDDTFFQF